MTRDVRFISYDLGTVLEYPTVILQKRRSLLPICGGAEEEGESCQSWRRNPEFIFPASS